MHYIERIKTFFLILLIMLFQFSNVTFLLGSPKRLAVFPDLAKPDVLRVIHNRVFVSQSTSIFIYSLDDFKLIKKFGQSGEGPKEFKINPPNDFLDIEIFPDYLKIHSIGKISIYSLNGEFLKEKAVLHVSSRQSIGPLYVGRVFDNYEGIVYTGVALFNPELKKIKEICRVKNTIQENGNIDLFEKNMRFQVVEDKIFVSAKKEFVIDVFDNNGTLVNTIKRDYQLVKATKEDKKIILQEVKRELKQMWPLFKERIKMGDYYPAIQTILFRDNKLFVPTYKSKNGMFEFFIYNKNGTYLQTSFLQLATINPLQPYPYDFYRGKIYQLIEDEKNEKWAIYESQVE
jgi:hypothetical protein